MDTDRERILAGTRVAVHVIGGAAIVFFFAVTVMIATAQQDVMSRMKTEQLSVGYSSALLMDRHARDADKQREAWQLEQQRTTEQLRSDQSQLSQAQGQADLAWAELGPLAGKVATLGLCDIAIPATADERARAVAATAIERCSPEGSMKSTAERTLKAATDQAGQFLTAVGPYLQKQAKLSSDQAKLDAIVEQIQLRTLTPDEGKAERSFSNMEVLLQPWMLGGKFLVQFPPALLQILLSFFSGLFGALLVTLVLIVYPKNLLGGENSAHVLERTMLGGLIALCVYIVLLGGTAVLGSGTPNEGAGSNNMAFAGIGILAGMFSDRVAGWLSKQADTFFRQS